MCADWPGSKATTPSDQPQWPGQKAATPVPSVTIKEAPPGALAQAVAPVLDVPREYSKEVHAAVNSMRHGFNRLTGKDEPPVAGESTLHKMAQATDPARVFSGLGEMALGGVNYLSAPLSAPVHALVGKPVGNTVGAVTGSKRAGKFAGDLADITAGGFTGAGLTRKAAELADTVETTLARRAAAKETGLSKPARQVIHQALGPEGSPDGVKIRKAPDAMLVDKHPNLKKILDVADQRAGPSAASGRQAIEERAAAAGDRLTGTLDETLPTSVGKGTIERDLRAGTAAERSAAYEAAYATPIDYSSETGRTLERLVKTRVPGSAISEANTLMRLEGAESQQIMAHVADDGTVTFEKMPDVRQLDYISRALNDAAYSTEGGGAMGGMTAKQRAYSNLSRELRDTLRDAAPNYGKALETAAQPIQARRALEFGSEAMRANMPRDEVAYRFSQMTEPEKSFARSGVRAYLDEIVANVKRTITDPNIDARQGMVIVKDLSSDAALNKLSVFLPPQQMRKLQEVLDHATTALDLRAAIAQNSKTAMRMLTERTVGEAVEPGLIKKAMQGKPINAMQNVVQRLTRTTPADIRRKEEKVYAEIVRALTSKEPEASRILESLKRAYADPNHNGFLQDEAAPGVGGALTAAGDLSQNLSGAPPALAGATATQEQKPYPWLTYAPGKNPAHPPVEE